MMSATNPSPAVSPVRAGIAMHAADFIRSARIRGMSVRIYAAGDKISFVSRDNEAENELFGELADLLENDSGPLAVYDGATPGAVEPLEKEGIVMGAEQRWRGAVPVSGAGVIA